MYTHVGGGAKGGGGGRGGRGGAGERVKTGEGVVRFIVLSILWAAALTCAVRGGGEMSGLYACDLKSAPGRSDLPQAPVPAVSPNTLDIPDLPVASVWEVVLADLVVLGCLVRLLLLAPLAVLGKVLRLVCQEFLGPNWTWNHQTHQKQALILELPESAYPRPPKTFEVLLLVLFLHPTPSETPTVTDAQHMPWLCMRGGWGVGGEEGSVRPVRVQSSTPWVQCTSLVRGGGKMDVCA